MNDFGVDANVTQDKPFEVTIKIGEKLLVVSILAMSLMAIVALKRKR